VAGTWAVATIALFGERLRAFVFRPSLQIRLLDACGEFVIQTVQSQQNGQITQSEIPCRYYHIQLTNTRRLTVAHDAQVIVSSIESEGPNGQFQVIYTGMLPLGWRHPELHSLQRSIGPVADADFLFIRADGVARFTPVLIPNNFPIEHRGGMRLRVTLQARSTEADSKFLRVTVSWNGQWHSGATEMSRNVNFDIRETDDI
jgi:hypothetical protein